MSPVFAYIEIGYILCIHLSNFYSIFFIFTLYPAYSRRRKPGVRIFRSLHFLSYLLDKEWQHSTPRFICYQSDDTKLFELPS